MNLVKYVWELLEKGKSMILKILEKIPATLYSKDYLRMKERTTFKRIELIVALLVFVLLVFRFIFGTALNGLLLITLVFLAIYYMWFGFFLFSRVALRDLATPKSRSQVSAFMVISSMLMGIIYSIASIAIVYGVFFYGGMNFMLSVAFFLIVVATGLTLFYHWLNQADRPLLFQYYKRSAILGLFCLSLLITPVDTRLQVLFHNHPEFIEAFKEVRSQPDSDEAKNKLREARSYFR